MVKLDGQSMTLEEFLAIPDDDVERMLINGAVKELETIRRSRLRAIATAKLAHFLLCWLDDRPNPKGEVLAGGVDFRLSTGSIVRADLCYVSHELTYKTVRSEPLLSGAPSLALEILAPSDTQGEIDAKIECFLDGGVPHIWLVNPRIETVTVFKPDDRPRLG